MSDKHRRPPLKRQPSDGTDWTLSGAYHYDAKSLVGSSHDAHSLEDGIVEDDHTAISYGMADDSMMADDTMIYSMADDSMADNTMRYSMADSIAENTMRYGMADSMAENTMMYSMADSTADNNTMIYSMADSMADNNTMMYSMADSMADNTMRYSMADSSDWKCVNVTEEEQLQAMETSSVSTWQTFSTQSEWEAANRQPEVVPEPPPQEASWRTKAIYRSDSFDDITPPAIPMSARRHRKQSFGQWQPQTPQPKQTSKRQPPLSETSSHPKSITHITPIVTRKKCADIGNETIVASRRGPSVEGLPAVPTSEQSAMDVGHINRTTHSSAITPPGPVNPQVAVSQPNEEATDKKVVDSSRRCTRRKLIVIGVVFLLVSGAIALAVSLVVTRRNDSQTASSSSGAGLGVPTFTPTLTPSMAPSTPVPSLSPSNQSSGAPTDRPSHAPSNSPTRVPSMSPTANPTRRPSPSPTPNPTRRPTPPPTPNPTRRPTPPPTPNPTRRPPTLSPTRLSTPNPTRSPTTKKTPPPTSVPTVFTATTAAPTPWWQFWPVEESP